LIITSRACRNRLLPIRNLIGEPVARLQVHVDHPEDHDDHKAGQGIAARMADHLGGDPAAEPLQRVERSAGGAVMQSKVLLAADQ
jgi:hypothetical protein